MIGCDIVEISRIEGSVKKFGDKFLDRILTPNEKAIFIEKGSPMSFLAGRFSAKEAVSKALGTGIAGSLSFTDIEILPDGNGKPVLSLRGLIDKGAEVSISHSKDNAIAVCFISEV